jgi:decaprenyl-phosphate phosphoribosyltransferase
VVSGEEVPRAASPTPQPWQGSAVSVPPLRALVGLARPRQWLKNVLVIAAPGAAGALGRSGVPLRVGVAFVAFCALASGIYAINDVRDADEDRQHPVKCRRPVAAGTLTPRAALAFGGGSIALGLALCLAVRPLLALDGAGYLAITVTYTFVWRRILLLDVIAVAGGFVLRAVAGGVAADVDLSAWFLLVVSCAAVLVAAGKRSSELRRTAAAGGPARRVLERYTEPRLRVLLLTSGCGALIAYVGWATVVTVADGVPWRLLTIVPFVTCLARYGMLLRSGRVEAPEDLLARDRPLLLGAASWLVLFALGVNAGA